MGRYLGIDFGAKRIGLAVADNGVKLARPLTTVGPNELIQAIAEAGPFEAVVVGLPRGLDGQETAQTTAVREFGDIVLRGQLQIEPVYQDEAGTSELAHEQLKASGRPYTKSDVDAEAAAIILQDYLDSV